MAHIMYDAWNNHGIKPSEIYKMSYDELAIIRAFYIVKYERQK